MTSICIFFNFRIDIVIFGRFLLFKFSEQSRHDFTYSGWTMYRIVSKYTMWFKSYEQFYLLTTAGWTDAQPSHLLLLWTNVDMLQPCGHLTAWLYCMWCFLCFCHLPIWCPVWYFIVWIPDLCLLPYFYLMHKYAKFDRNIPCGSRVILVTNPHIKSLQNPF